jgi:hypothetical protein
MLRAVTAKAVEKHYIPASPFLIQMAKSLASLVCEAREAILWRISNLKVFYLLQNSLRKAIRVELMRIYELNKL